MGTQSDPTTLCSQTASAIYLGSNKPHAGGHCLLAWSLLVWGAHSLGLALQGTGTCLLRPAVPLLTPLLGARTHRGKEGEASGAPTRPWRKLPKMRNSEHQGPGAMLRGQGKPSSFTPPTSPRGHHQASALPTHLGPSGAQIVKYQLLAQPWSKGLYPCRYRHWSG